MIPEERLYINSILRCLYAHDVKKAIAIVDRIVERSGRTDAAMNKLAALIPANGMIRVTDLEKITQIIREYKEDPNA